MGELIEPLNPDPSKILIEDIAHALSNQCRFTGHVRYFYSVAQHSVHVAELLESNGYPRDIVFIGLMHDASEAYLSDLARPVKRQPEISGFYKAAEQRLEEAIAGRFGFQYPFPPEIKWADDVLLRTEQRDLMPDRIRIPGDEYGNTIYPYPPEEAKEDFLYAYRELGGRYAD